MATAWGTAKECRPSEPLLAEAAVEAAACCRLMGWSSKSPYNSVRLVARLASPPVSTGKFLIAEHDDAAVGFEPSLLDGGKRRRAIPNAVDVERLVECDLSHRKIFREESIQFNPSITVGHCGRNANDDRENCGRRLTFTNLVLNLFLCQSRRWARHGATVGGSKFAAPRTHAKR